MPEIRQIRVGGVTYDVVASEDEVSASRAQQYATQAQNSATLAGNYKDTAGNYATTAKNYATTAKNCQEECLVQAVNANDAADRAEAIVGGQFVSYGQDQGLSDTYKAQARKNISAGASNRNLLDNPFFTVNQRSATTVTLNGTEAYIADRWIAGAFGTYTRNSDGTITITVPSDGNFAGLTQRIDPVYKGGTYTYSIRLSDDTVISLQGTMPSGSGLNVYTITINGTAWQVLFRSDGSAYWITLRCNVANATLTVKAVKLELGSYSTLANDVPPDYGEELRKCQRYFYRMSNATYLTPCIVMAENATNAYGLMHLPVPMRAQPTLSYSGSFICWLGSNATTVDVTIISINNTAYPSVNPSVVSLRAQTAGGLTLGTRYDLQSRSNTPAYIDLSADL